MVIIYTLHYEEQTEKHVPSISCLRGIHANSLKIMDVLKIIISNTACLLLCRIVA